MTQTWSWASTATPEACPMVQSLGVELHDWRRRPAAFRWRRIKRQRLFVQWLGPCSVDRESRNVLGASHNRRSARRKRVRHTISSCSCYSHYVTEEAHIVKSRPRSGQSRLFAQSSNRTSLSARPGGAEDADARSDYPPRLSVIADIGTQPGRPSRPGEFHPESLSRVESRRGPGFE